ncbi:MAG: class I SAM-dependent methyltransferase [Chitinophagaceae bacterium]
MIDSTTTNDDVGAATLSIISSANRFNRWMYDQIKPYIIDEVLEVGSGIGNLSRFLIEEGHQTTLSDYNLDYAKTLKCLYEFDDRVSEILTIDLQDPDFDQTYMNYKEKFNSIVMLNVIEHLENDHDAIRNCRFLLKNSGNLIILAPSYQFLFCRLDKELGHFRRYTKSTLSHLLKKEKFKLVSKKHFNFLGIFGWLITGKLIAKNQIGKNEMSAFDKLVPIARIMDKIIFNKAGLSVVVISKKI